jgi:hypothetical protein
MKSHISWKGVLISISVLILFFGTFNLAMADITFPNTFVSGQPAVASEVNDNFQAINTRQTASLSTLAGTYNFRMLATWKQDKDLPYEYREWDDGLKLNIKANGTITHKQLCSNSTIGTVTLNSNGTVTVSGTSYVDCDDPPTGSFSDSGTWTVDSTGAGTLTLSTSTNIIQASKDLNTIIMRNNPTGGRPENTIGVAVRQ